MAVWYPSKGFDLFLLMDQESYTVYQYGSIFSFLNSIPFDKDCMVISFMAYLYRGLVQPVQLSEFTLNSSSQMSLNMMRMPKQH